MVKKRSKVERTWLTSMRCDAIWFGLVLVLVLILVLALMLILVLVLVLVSVCLGFGVTSPYPPLYRRWGRARRIGSQTSGFISFSRKHGYMAAIQTIPNTGNTVEVDSFGFQLKFICVRPVGGWHRGRRRRRCRCRRICLRWGERGFGCQSNLLMVFRLPLTAIQFPMNVIVVVAIAIAADIACNAKLWHLLASKVAQPFRPLHPGANSARKGNEKFPFSFSFFAFIYIYVYELHFICRLIYM